MILAPLQIREDLWLHYHGRDGMFYLWRSGEFPYFDNPGQIPEHPDFVMGFASAEAALEYAEDV